MSNEFELENGNGQNNSIIMDIQWKNYQTKMTQKNIGSWKDCNGKKTNFTKFSKTMIQL